MKAVRSRADTGLNEPERTSETPSGKNISRRTLLGVIGAGAALIVGGSTVQNLTASSSLGSALGTSGYTIYTVTGDFPTYDPQTFRIRVNGSVQHPLTLSLDELKAIDSTTLKATFQCVTGWIVPNQTFGGARLTKVIEKAGPKSDAQYVNFTSFDGTYTESLPLARAMKSDVIVVTHLDGAPLSRPHGAPVRLFVDGEYGYKSIKWLSEITLSPTPIVGYWEQNGYPNNATIA
ncbi:MAG: molybdopterin-dependent oxidoreductase [Acidimicrobiales bacterium]